MRHSLLLGLAVLFVLVATLVTLYLLNPAYFQSNSGSTVPALAPHEERDGATEPIKDYSNPAMVASARELVGQQLSPWSTSDPIHIKIRWRVRDNDGDIESYDTDIWRIDGNIRIDLVPSGIPGRSTPVTVVIREDGKSLAWFPKWNQWIPLAARDIDTGEAAVAKVAEEDGLIPRLAPLWMLLRGGGVDAVALMVDGEIEAEEKVNKDGTTSASLQLTGRTMSVLYVLPDKTDDVMTIQVLRPPAPSLAARAATKAAQQASQAKRQQSQQGTRTGPVSQAERLLLQQQRQQERETRKSVLPGADEWYFLVSILVVAEPVSPEGLDGLFERPASIPVENQLGTESDHIRRSNDDVATASLAEARAFAATLPAMPETMDVAAWRAMRRGPIPTGAEARTAGTIDREIAALLHRDLVQPYLDTAASNAQWGAAGGDFLAQVVEMLTGDEPTSAEVLALQVQGEQVMASGCRESRFMWAYMMAHAMRPQLQQWGDLGEHVEAAGQIVFDDESLSHFYRWIALRSTGRLFPVANTLPSARTSQQDGVMSKLSYRNAVIDDTLSQREMFLCHRLLLKVAALPEGPPLNLETRHVAVLGDRGWYLAYLFARRELELSERVQEGVPELRNARVQALHRLRARALLVQSHALYPDMPEVATDLMRIAQERGTLSEVTYWYDEALRCQADYEPAHELMAGMLQPGPTRPFRDDTGLAALAEEWLDTERYDTAIPSLYVRLFLARLAADRTTPAPLASPTIRETIRRVSDGYWRDGEVRPGTEGYAGLSGYLDYLQGDLESAAKRLPSSIYTDAIAYLIDTSAGEWPTWVQLRMLLSPAGQRVPEVIAAMRAGQSAEALTMLDEILAATPSPAMREYLRAYVFADVDRAYDEGLTPIPLVLGDGQLTVDKGIWTETDDGHLIPSAMSMRDQAVLRIKGIPSGPVRVKLSMVLGAHLPHAQRVHDAVGIGVRLRVTEPGRKGGHLEDRVIAYVDGSPQMLSALPGGEHGPARARYPSGGLDEITIDLYEDCLSVWAGDVPCLLLLPHDIDLAAIESWYIYKVARDDERESRILSFSAGPIPALPNGTGSNVAVNLARLDQGIVAGDAETAERLLTGVWTHLPTAAPLAHRDLAALLRIRRRVLDRGLGVSRSFSIQDDAKSGDDLINVRPEWLVEGTSLASRPVGVGESMAVLPAILQEGRVTFALPAFISEYRRPVLGVSFIAGNGSTYAMYGYSNGGYEGHLQTPTARTCLHLSHMPEGIRKEFEPIYNFQVTQTETTLNYGEAGKDFNEIRRPLLAELYPVSPFAAYPSLGQRPVTGYVLIYLPDSAHGGRFIDLAVRPSAAAPAPVAPPAGD